MSFQEIKINLIEILSESTSYGLPKVFKSKRTILKLFWLAFFLMGSIVSIYFTVDSINSYLKYEVIYQKNIIYENPMQFPTITLCIYDSSYLNKSLKSLITLCEFDNNKDCENNPDEFFQVFQFSQQLFNGFSQVCLQFNSGKIIQNSTVEKHHNGFHLSLISRPSIDIYIDHQESKSFINGTVYKSPDFTIDSNMNKSIEFTLDKIEDFKLGSPYNQCYQDVVNEFPLNKTLINFFQQNNISYKQTNCYQLCAELEYINTNPCECTNTSLGIILN
jgi:hypothetical protein